MVSLVSPMSIPPEDALVLEAPPPSALGERGDPARQHGALVAELAAVVGEERAAELDVDAEVHFLMLQSTPDLSLAHARMQSALESMRSAVGDEYAKRYYISLHRKLALLRDADVAAAAVPALQQGSLLFEHGELLSTGDVELPSADAAQERSKTGLESISDNDLARVLKQRLGPL